MRKLPPGERAKRKREADRRYYREHRESAREKQRAWNRAHKAQRRAYQLLYLYGISVEDYDKLLLKQNGVCALCGRPPGRRDLAVDHKHGTRIVRGLLCPPCNRALGAVEYSPGWLERAKEYLEW